MVVCIKEVYISMCVLFVDAYSSFHPLIVFFSLTPSKKSMCNQINQTTSITTGQRMLHLDTGIQLFNFITETHNALFQAHIPRVSVGSSTCRYAASL